MGEVGLRSDRGCVYHIFTLGQMLEPYSYPSHLLLRCPKINEQCFEDIRDRILVTHEYPLFLIAMFHIHKVKRSELLRGKLILWLEDGFPTCATSEASWQS